MRNLTISISVFVMLVVVALCGAAGRLLGFVDQTSGWVVLALAAILAVANLILIIISPAGKLFRFKWGITLGYATFLIGVGAASVLNSYHNTPLYMIQSIATKTEVYDVEGTKGRIETTVQVKILKDGVEYIRWGGLGATGNIENVAYQGMSGDFNSEVIDKDGQWELTLRFPRPPKKGEFIAFSFGFDVVGAPPGGDTYMDHDVKWPTKNLQIVIKVNQGRPCKTVEAYSVDASAPGADVDPSMKKADKQTEPTPLLLINRAELQWSKADPQEGRRYTVVCHQ
jgi:hypothetical protein